MNSSWPSPVSDPPLPTDGWWSDPENGDLYTLVCAPVAGIKARLVQKALTSGEPEDAAPTPEETPEQAHQRKLELLKEVLNKGLE